MDLLDYYRDNLNYLRGLSAEFAAEFPKIARRLLISEFDCQDPYIERLLEGTAFLSAKVEKKLDEGYYPFLESVLNSIAPDSVYPVPSGAVLETFPNMADENIRKGVKLKAGAVYETVIPGINTPCRFSAAADTALAPFTLSLAEYLHDLSGLGINERKAESALHLRFSSPTGALTLTNEIQLFLALSEADVSLLFRLLFHDTLTVYIKQGDAPYRAVPGVSFSLPLITGEDLFGRSVKSNTKGLKILQSFLTYPDFFKFFVIAASGSASGGLSVGGFVGGSASAATAEIVITFKRREQALAANIKTSSVKLNCVPVLNVFSRRSDRVTVDRDSGGGAGTGAYEFHIIPDRTAMRDYEVVAVKNIDFYNERNSLIFSAANFYNDDLSREKEKQVFFSARRRRKLVDRRSTARSTYEGTEVFAAFSPIRDDAYQFAADLLVTNRDLPLLLQQGAEFSSTSAMAPRAAFVSLPTRPNYPLAERGDSADFSRLSHVVLNLSALLWQSGERPLELLRNMLRSYPVRPAEETERMINGITALSSKSDTFRFIRKGVVFYEWGWRLTLTLDEDAYAGMGFYTFARVLAEILKAFTPINTISEIRFTTLQSGVIAVWKTSEDQ